MTQELPRDLTLSCWPTPFPLEGGGYRRRWIVRLTSGPRAPLDHETLAEEMDRKTRELLRAAFSDTDAHWQRYCPNTEIFEIDPTHVCVSIVTREPEHASDALLTSQYGPMHCLDEYVRIEDLQGLPRRLWLHLKGNG